ncbi:MAG: hypothetical protein EP330_23695 [Deltaproteobacteria bacterium]|nr:MAG: hypothetical protein EP330_23695 [Deltaproteobacteria bacterium]
MRLAPLLLLTACAGLRQHHLPHPVALPGEGPVRVVLVGDTGVVEGALPGDAAACDPHGRGHGISTDCRVRMLDAMRAEQPDALVALGDLVYWSGPVCPRGELTESARTRMDRVLGTGLGEVGPPVFLALGNHDKHQRHGHPAAEACYLAYAEQHPRIAMPDLTYTVDLGEVLIVVVDTTRPPRGKLADEVSAAVVRHRGAHPDGWVLFAGHHPVRTYRDDTDQPMQMRGWADDLGVDIDLWASGHAHYLQMTVDRGLPNVTSGAGGKHRRIADCPAEKCGEAELWSWSEGWGYAVATMDAERLEVVFKDVSGEELYRWQRGHAPLTSP